MPDIYQERGFKNRQDYIEDLAADYDVPLADLQAVADLLGPGEDFDGLVCAAQDMDLFGHDTW